MENLTQRWIQSGPFFPKSGHFFDFQKRAMEVFPLAPNCTPAYIYTVSKTVKISQCQAKNETTVGSYIKVKQ